MRKISYASTAFYLKGRRGPPCSSIRTSIRSRSRSARSRSAGTESRISSHSQCPTGSGACASRARWGMLFRGARPLPRHPSQLYQFGLEGVLLFVILWVYSSKARPTAAVSGAFLLGYGGLRFAVEYFREPDDFLGLLALNLSMGQ